MIRCNEGANRIKKRGKESQTIRTSGNYVKCNESLKIIKIEIVSQIIKTCDFFNKIIKTCCIIVTPLNKK